MRSVLFFIAMALSDIAGKSTKEIVGMLAFILLVFFVMDIIELIKK